MLVRFAVTNFKSIAEPLELSLVASDGEPHASHVVDAARTDRIPILKLAVIYGANASGKSNICRAIDSAREMVVFGARTNRLKHLPYKLDQATLGEPTKYEFEIAVGDRYYLYSFSITSRRVHTESLYETTRESESCLFKRDARGGFDFCGITPASDESLQFLDFTAKGTPKKRLFVTECQERNVAAQVPEAAPVQDVFRWFAESLVTIFPESLFMPLQFALRDDADFRERLRELLAKADTGVEEIVLKRVPRLHADIEVDLLEKLDGLSIDTDGGVFVVNHPDDSRYLVQVGGDGEPEIYRVVTQRRNAQGELVDFKTSEESAGTRRLIDLFPSMIAKFGQGKVFVIDEVDRSLHPALTRHFVESFLDSCSTMSSQLVITTHEDDLLDGRLLRSDEVWFANKDESGRTNLIPLHDFKDQHELDVRRGYLDGRFGGLPLLGSMNLERFHVPDA